MAYTDPRTWVTGELVTASLMNVQIRDNLDAVIEGTTGAYVNAVTGPHAIGGSTIDYARLLLTGAFTSGGASTAAFGTYISGALTGHSGDSAAIAGVKLDNTIVTAGNCTTIAQIWVNEPQITVGAGSVTNSASVYIQGAATEATNDYALWVDSGAVKIDSSLVVGATAVAAGANALAVGYEASASGDNSLSAGYTPLASGDNALAIGYNMTASADHTIGLGYEGTVSASHSVLMTLSSTSRTLSTGSVFSVMDGKVGIDTLVPVSLLDVRGPTGTGATTAGLLTLATNELTIVDDDQLGRINFQAPLESSGTDAIVAAASIWAEANAGFSNIVNSTDIVLATSADGAPVEHLRLDSRGTMRYGYEGTGKGTFQNESWGTVLGNNTYYNGSAWVAVATGASSNITQDSAGNILFRSAPSVSAGAGTTDVTHITINPDGDIGIGGAPDTYAAVTLRTAFTSSGTSSVARGFDTDRMSVTGVSGDTTHIVGSLFSAAMTVQDVAETVANVAQVMVDEPAITKGAAATITNATTLQVVGVPTEATNNYAFWVDSTGTSRFDGGIGLKGSAENELALTTSGGNAVISSRDNMYLNIDSNSDGASEGFIFGKDRTGTSGGTQLMSLDETGKLKVGVLESDPVGLLTVGSDTYPQCVINRSSSQVKIGIDIRANTTVRSQIYYDDSVGNGVLCLSGRVQTASASLFSHDERWGVGTASPSTTLEVNGSLSKGSGSFRIAHPLPSKKDTHKLVHSFIEGPKADLIYRGIVTLSDGAATVDLDDAAGMTTGTWVLLCRDEQVFTSNETGWYPVRGSVTGSVLSIDCEENDCTDTVSWMVVAERQDEHMYDTEWTDEDGRPIVEPENPEEPDPEDPATEEDEEE
jgi:hypothetical protein